MSGTLVSGCGGGGGGQSAAVVPTILSAPANITADAGKNRVTLNWSNVPTATSFNLYYGTSPGISKSSTKLSDVHSMYIKRDLANGTQYYFAVAAVGPTGEGELSSEVSALPSATAPQPAPVEVRAASLNGQINLSWAPGFEASAAATTYTVYYSTVAPLNKATSIKKVNAVSPQILSGLTNNIPYFLAVTANSANGESSLSYEVSATPLASPPPAAPEKLVATEIDKAISFSWSTVTGATSYNLYYGTENEVSQNSGIKVSGITSPFLLTGLTNKSAYFAVITAVGAGGESFDSPIVSATPLASPPVPKMLAIPATIPSGFQMGDNFLDPIDQAPYAIPVHTVHIGTFQLARYETTYSEWVAIYDWAIANGYSFDRTGRNGGLNMGTHMPVTKVSWYDLVKWLNARSEMEGRTPVYYTATPHTNANVYRSGNINLVNADVEWGANGYRLPTDAEWEWASRGGLVGKQYPWGDVLSASMANYDRGTSTSVGSYPANGFGLYDMAGNVWEWTWDRDATSYSASEVTDPHGNDTGLMRTRRGGSYVYGERYLRNFDKMFREVNYNGPYFGFRVASSQP